ncbi:MULTISPECIES: substrate-binding domain-containing protein [Paraburkholderia]|jgi:ribose transport system substrate-binding protein|uniref:Monosaccharide ABC transporter substrate-binding protein, CUT2 family n=1 Tax=Paraburkholderia phenazinium TaxID=60549 RepID=A0A1N6JTU2_9BURK|nr:substrate-binding domain-containing protein [Paraburkholderia phenazinium]SIO47768.1 monosaccharide ABC transporter substrate-binding protein, CUT2 family [Paraburkholderia phenazinium]
MKTLLQTTLLVAGAAVASGAWAAGTPLAKECGPNNDYVIGFSQANFKEPYREHVNHELERLVKNYPKFKLVIADGQASVNTQVSQVENFQTQHVDLLMISPFEAAPLTPAVTAVYKSGVPVIELDRKTTGDNYTAFVGGDNRQIAKEAGEWAAKTLLPDGGEAAILEGLPSSSPAIERLEGFKAGIAANPKIKLVAVQPVDWMEDQAVTVFSAMLQSHPDIKLVYTSNDLAAAGAYIAAKQAGKTDQVKIIGTDGLPGPSGGIRAVADGQWAATYTYPTGAAQALELAKKILIDCATEVPRNVTVPTQRIDQNNAKSLFGKEQF